MAEGKIESIGNEVVEGTTMYYVRIQGNPQIYSFYSKLAPKIIFAKQGDGIKITFIPVESEIIAATEVELK